MKLTGTKVAEAKPANRERKLSDGGGLYLLVKPNGTKAWRYKYRFNGRELTLAVVQSQQERIAKLQRMMGEQFALR